MAERNELGKAYVQVVPSAEGIEGNLIDVLAPEATMAGDEAGNNFSNTFGPIVKKAIVALGLGKLIKDSIENGMNFETSIAKVSTLWSGTGEELTAFQGQLMDLSSETGIAAAQLAEAAYSAESASVPMGNLGSMLEGSAKLATAGFTDIDTALSATAKTMNAYGMVSDDIAATQANMEAVQRVLIQTQNKGITTVGELGASLAQVTPTAASFGVSFDQVGAALAGMTAQGTPTAQATAQLNALIAELGKEGTQASNKFRELTGHIQDGGLSFAEAMEAGWDLSDVLSLFDEEAQSTGTSMVDMFSSIEAGKAALSVWNSDWVGNMEAMGTSADVVGDSYDKMAETASKKMAKVKEAFTNIGIDFFLAIADPLKAALDGIADAIDFFGQHADVLVPILGGLVTAFIAFQAATSFLSVFETFSGLIGAVGAAFAGLNLPLLGVTLAIGAVVAAGIYLYNHWDTVKAKAAEIWGAVVATFNSVKANISAAVENMRAVVSEKWNAIKSAASNIWNGIKTTITNLVDGLKTSLSNTWTNIKNTASTAWENVKTAALKPVESLRDKCKEIIDKIKGIFNITLPTPKLKLPHLSISGRLSLDPPSIPKVSVSWYATGGIMDDPTLFAYGGGERGSEAILPLDPFWERLDKWGENLRANTTGGGEYTVNVPLYIDGREVARATATFNQDELNRLQRNANRKAGAVWD